MGDTDREVVLPVLYSPIPHDEHLEDGFIGILVINESIPPEINLSPDDIHNQRNRWIYKQLIEMDKAGIPLQAPAITKYLREHKRYKPEIDTHLSTCIEHYGYFTGRTPLSIQTELQLIAFEKKREIAKHEAVNLLAQNNIIAAWEVLGRLLNEVNDAE